jgi:rubrerythrin
VSQVAVEVGEQAATPSTAIDVPSVGPGFELAVAGEKLAGEFRCTECGYGAVVQRALPQCPMCGGVVWESRTPPVRPLAG